MITSNNLSYESSTTENLNLTTGIDFMPGYASSSEVSTLANLTEETEPDYKLICLNCGKTFKSLDPKQDLCYKCLCDLADDFSINYD